MFNIKSVEIYDGFESKKFELREFQCWNQRLFCLGKASDDELKFFITTDGFDRLLYKTNSSKSLFTFKKKPFNPYLCSRDSKDDIYTESSILDKLGDSFIKEDIGPKEYSGTYKELKVLSKETIKHLYFETLHFEKDKFDLFKYQNEDEFLGEYEHNPYRDKLPFLVNLYDEAPYNINIIHAVNIEGDKEYFDIESVIEICEKDLTSSDDNLYYSIIKCADPKSVVKEYSINKLVSLIRSTDILKNQSDCGHRYIEKNIKKKKLKRKHAFNYLYEYYKFINRVMSSKRKKNVSMNIGQKIEKKFQFLPVFTKDDMSSAKIVYFKGVGTVESKDDFARLVQGDPLFQINCYYDYKVGKTVYEDFESASELLKFIKTKIGSEESIRLSGILSTWFNYTEGYNPRVIKLTVRTKANYKTDIKVSHKIDRDKLAIYSVPIIEDDGEVYGTGTYVNLFQFLYTFGLHIPKIRNILLLDKWNDRIFSELEKSFPIHHIIRDIRRNILPLEDDKPISECMISMNHAISLLTLFEKIQGDYKKKNIYWYLNANSLLQSFPDINFGDVSSRYQEISLKGYVNDKS